MPPVSPGEMLLEEFLKPLAWSQYRLAKKIHVPQGRIGEIIAGKRTVTTDTDLRLCRLFGLSDGWWLRLQADYDVARAKPVMSNVLAGITPVVRNTQLLNTPPFQGRSHSDAFGRNIPG